MKLSIVIPIFKDITQLPDLLDRLAHTPSLPKDHEILLVDDSHENKVWQQLLRLKASRHGIKLMHLKYNVGQHYATWLGLSQAVGDILVTLDADLQHPPEEIPALLAKLTDNTDLVYGTARAGHPITRRLISTVYHQLFSPLVKANKQTPSSFRSFTQTLNQKIQIAPGLFASIDIPLTHHATRIATAQVRHDKNPTGSTTYTVWARCQQALTFIYRTRYFFMLAGGLCMLMAIAGLTLIITSTLSLGILPFLAGITGLALLPIQYHKETHRLAALSDAIDTIIP